MPGMQEFYVRAAANEGRRLPLRTPDGRPTDHWLQIRSQWSDEFRFAKSEAERAISAATSLPPKELQAVADEQRLVLLAALIGGWSFDEPCTPEAAREFLLNAPQIAQKVNTFAGDDQRFFRNGSTDSMSGHEPSLPSGKSRRVAKSR